MWIDLLMYQMFYFFYVMKVISQFSLSLNITMHSNLIEIKENPIT